MFTGNEHLLCEDSQLPFTMLNFWQWAYSNILHNMQRGTFAEYIVKCALESGGVATRQETGTGLEPYDLEGPIIPSTGNVARVEVKSAAFVQAWDIKHPERANFSIAPAKIPDKTGDYPRLAGRQRNNDLYVFTLYTATDKDKNILDLSLWEFYVLPTYKIESDERLWKQKTISLKTVKQLCPTLSFDMLCDAIIESCNSIPENAPIPHIFPAKQPVNSEE